jgi:hypothetical protein
MGKVNRLSYICLLFDKILGVVYSLQVCLLIYYEYNC